MSAKATRGSPSVSAKSGRSESYDRTIESVASSLASARKATQQNREAFAKGVLTNARSMASYIAQRQSKRG